MPISPEQLQGIVANQVSAHEIKTLGGDEIEDGGVGRQAHVAMAAPTGDAGTSDAQAIPRVFALMTIIPRNDKHAPRFGELNCSRFHFWVVVRFQMIEVNGSSYI